MGKRVRLPYHAGQRIGQSIESIRSVIEDQKKIISGTPMAIGDIKDIARDSATKLLEVIILLMHIETEPYPPSNNGTKKDIEQG